MPASHTRHKSPVALLLVDVINHFEFPDGDRLLRNALRVAPQLARLTTRARRAKIPVIYVNDNFGQWRSDAAKLIEYCVRPTAPGRAFVDQLRPDKDDYFVLKPMHSAFYQTPLDLLLRHLDVSALVLCGLATNSCILCSAHDANMRNIRLFVPGDCCAARSRREHEQALQHIKGIGSARIMTSATLRFSEMLKDQRAKGGTL